MRQIALGLKSRLKTDRGIKDPRQERQHKDKAVTKVATLLG